jgi:hypothetical protein
MSFAQSAAFDAPAAATAPLDVITFGEAMALLIAGTAGPLAEVKQFEKGLAGAETNVSVG